MYAVPSVLQTLLPRAAEYKSLSLNVEACGEGARRFPWSERHLQALWFDCRLRPLKLKTSRGEAVTVENPGRWNLEAGPDFTGAVLRIGRGRRRLAGDAEIHIVPADWQAHGHAGDPRYAGVRFHITWFPGPADEALFPPGTVHIALADCCDADLDVIDPAAYPYAEPRAAAGFPLSDCDPDAVAGFLESAGEERLRQKAERMGWLLRQRGAAQALYEETAAALGYKQNKAPFRELARRVPLTCLDPLGSDWHRHYALLMGLSGLLPSLPGSNWPPPARAELRAVWDAWWRGQHLLEESDPLGRTDWRLDGLRPLNHPLRRLCALAQWTASGFFREAGRDPALATAAALPADPECFWSRHTGWCSPEKRAALAGKDRLQAVELNVFIPYRLAAGDGGALGRLPAEPLNSVIREAAHALFGPDHPAKLYRTALARQGLIQIFTDYILSGRVAVLAGVLPRRGQGLPNTG